MRSAVILGDSGPEVELLQRALQSLGYDVGEPDGHFGPRTEAGVVAYQNDFGLYSVEFGTCCDATWASIESQFHDLEGLRTAHSVDDYARGAYGIWNSSMSAVDRLAALERQINEELSAAGVPYVRFELDPATSPVGNFAFATWVVSFEPSPFQPENAEWLTPDRQAFMASAAYHEARHAEQWYQMARLLAGLHDMDAVAINNKTRIRLDVAMLAAANPIQACTRSNGPAFDWYENVYGAGGGNRHTILASLKDSVHGKWDEYRTALPEEADAWDAMGSVQRDWRQYASGGGTVALPTLARGDTNTAQVRYLQHLLDWHSYFVGAKIDGDFGPQTELAVQAFQGAHHLEPDGIVTPETWKALLP
jgi:peptidoglycan hydrolase-like protein with peptidoglycan-binding domain